MSPDRPGIPVTADDVDHDFDATASPPPGARRGQARASASDYGDPGHLAEDDEWAEIVARAEGGQP